MFLTYLASPYTHHNPDVKLVREMRAQEVAAKLMKRGLYVYSPIVHSAELDRSHPGLSYDYWIEHSLLMLRRSQAMLVYPVSLEAFVDSKGTQIEIDYCVKRNKPWHILQYAIESDLFDTYLDLFVPWFVKQVTNRHCFTDTPPER